MEQTTLAYLAGIVDGEGYIGIKRSKAYACQGRNTPGYHARIQVRMVTEEAIRLIAETLGGWYYREPAHAARGRPLFCYQVSDAKAEAALRALRPFLRVKAASADTVLALRELQRSGQDHRTKITGYRTLKHWCGKDVQVANRSFSDEYVARCQALWERCRELNRVGV